jgi:hypothetical protein
MAARFVIIDRETLLLLPADMRQWVPENHLSHANCHCRNQARKPPPQRCGYGEEGRSTGTDTASLIISSLSAKAPSFPLWIPHSSKC